MRLTISRRIALALTALALSTSFASAQFMAPDSASTRVGIENSATGSTGIVAATLPAVQGKQTFLCGFSIQSNNPTAGIVVNPTVTGLAGGAMTFVYSALAAAATVQPPAPLNVTFTPCIQSSAQNTAVVVTLPALGAGTTSAAVNAWGYAY